MVMNALVKTGRCVAVRRVPVPAPGADDVLVRVALAALCRTDLYVAEGRIPGPDPIVLGHEFSGVVERVGAAVEGLRPGDRVAVCPMIACRDCPSCRAGDEVTCLRLAMLGVDRDGAFAERVAVPGHCVYRLPDSLNFAAAAFAEPLAAALAVLNAGLRPEERGLVLGRNRFATLVERVLRAHGFGRVEVRDPGGPGAEVEPDAYDFVIETCASRAVLAAAARAARPRGTVVLKSRQPGPAELDLLAAIAKELTFRAVRHGPFARAVGLLAEGRVGLDGLLGPVYALGDFEAAFAEARKAERAKVFLDPSAGHVRDR